MYIYIFCSKITINPANSSTTHQRQVLVSLTEFSNKTKFLRVAAHAAKHVLTQAEIRDLSDTFKQFDQDGSGHISLEEFVDGMSKHVEVR